MEPHIDVKGQRLAVSVLVPVLDEAHYIDDCIQTLIGQDYDGSLEIIVADGGSTDGTLEKLRSWQAGDSRLRVLHNPLRVQAHGLNLAAQVAGGDILVRADAHTTYAPDYVRRSVGHLSQDLSLAVGGPHVASGKTTFERAVAAAMSSPWVLGPSPFRHARTPRPADSLYLGAMWKAGFHAIGGFRALVSGVAEDADFYYRWRRTGGTVLVDPAIRSWYRPRTRWSAVARQYWRYGRGKAEFFRLHSRFPTWRPLAPGILVLGLGAGAAAFAVAGLPHVLLVVIALWGTVLVAAAASVGNASAARLRVIGVAATMQVSYGIGLLYGLLAPRRALRQPVGRHPIPAEGRSR